MYSIDNINTIHLEVTNKCQASCPMCARNLQGGTTNPFLKESEISFEDFVRWLSPGFVSQLDKLYMCGNLGDPIIAKDTVKIFEYCREHNTNIQLSMNTNGSARDSAFWKRLAELKVTVDFLRSENEELHKKAKTKKQQLNG